MHRVLEGALLVDPAPHSGPQHRDHHKQGRIIQPESSCIVYYMYYIILCIIFTYDFKTIRPKSNTYYVLIRIVIP